MDINNQKGNVEIDGVKLIFYSTDFGGRFKREDDKEIEVDRCLICNHNIYELTPHDFQSLVCLNHDPPIIYHRPWCNDQSIEQRELYEKEKLKIIRNMANAMGYNLEVLDS